MNRSEKIQRYLDGEMSEDELKAFREDLLSDPELKNELDLHKIIDNALQNPKEVQFRKKLDKTYEDYSNKRNNHKRNFRKKNRILVIISGTAALLIAALFFILKDQEINEKTLFDEYYSPLEIGFATRSFQNSDVNEYLVNGIKYYLEEDYQNSKLNFEKYLSYNSKDSLLAYAILGIDHLELGNYEEAENFFYRVSYSSFSYYQEHCRWYLGLTYLVNKKLKMAETVFSDFSENNSIYTDRAREILEKLPFLK